MNMKETQSDIKMNDIQKMMRFAMELQALAHKHGYEIFRDAAAQACFMASDDTEDFEDKSLTQKYRYLANCLTDAETNEPIFSSSYIED